MKCSQLEKFYLFPCLASFDVRNKTKRRNDKEKQMWLCKLVSFVWPEITVARLYIFFMLYCSINFVIKNYKNKF